MRDILPLIQRPSHYLGTEINAVHKEPGAVSLRVALAFPDLYEVGMAYLGQKILYNLVNARPQWWAERVFAPAQDVAMVLRTRDVRLATLESDTDLRDMDVLAFSLTHELCATTVLYMLDLAGIPFRAKDRGESWPLVIAGGGWTFQPGPMAPFFDLMVVGDGEEVLPELLEALEQCRQEGASKSKTLHALGRLPGVLDPAYQTPEAHEPCADQGIGPTVPVEKRLLADLDGIGYPVAQVIPFGKVVHSRFTLEIARGCTRGCRFCQAGMIYRPVRERSLLWLDSLLEQGLDATGFEELSFLSLSTGDFSALESLFDQSLIRCQREQISVSLPSLRVGSLSPRLMSMISGIRRTGVTLAPEAGSQRLRDVINKGITEQELLEHTTGLFQLGWNSLKLYFMIGLPTETEADLVAIRDLCLKVLETAGRGRKRLQITASISPFVPKPHTPFQWEEQLPMAEVKRRLDLLMTLMSPHRRITLRFHDPAMSFVEGIFSRGDQRLAAVVERAYRKGDVLTSWVEHFSLQRWMESCAEEGVRPEEYLRARDVDEALPWDHINCGVSRDFLRKERDRALSGKVTVDCRYGLCRVCGVCDVQGRSSTLSRQSSLAPIIPRLNLDHRDQDDTRDRSLSIRKEGADLHQKSVHLRLWYEKLGPAEYLSQLELQQIFERAFRRSQLPLTFSQGYHPLPLISFGRALPVGVGSLGEWLVIWLRREDVLPGMLERLNRELPIGLRFTGLDVLDRNKHQPQAGFEDFAIFYGQCADREHGEMRQWLEVLAADHLWLERETRKGLKRMDVRTFLFGAKLVSDHHVLVRFDWRKDYLSPLAIVQAVHPGIDPTAFKALKMKQWMPGEVPDAWCGDGAA